MKILSYILEAFLLILMIQTCAFGQSSDITSVTIPHREVQEMTVDSSYTAYKDYLELWRSQEVTQQELEKKYNEFADQIDQLHLNIPGKEGSQVEQPQNVTCAPKPKPLKEI